jgi:hypothetical protein
VREGKTSPEETIIMTTTLAPAGRWLSPADRCDRCGAAAYVLAVFRTGDLVFCAHHGRQYSATLAADAMLFYDESDRVLAE